MLSKSFIAIVAATVGFSLLPSVPAPPAAAGAYLVGLGISGIAIPGIVIAIGENDRNATECSGPTCSQVPSDREDLGRLPEPRPISGAEAERQTYWSGVPDVRFEMCKNSHKDADPVIVKWQPDGGLRLDNVTTECMELTGSFATEKGNARSCGPACLTWANLSEKDEELLKSAVAKVLADQAQFEESSF